MHLFVHNIDDKITREGPTATAWSVDSTRAWAYALFKSPANMHGSRKIKTYRSVCVMSEVYYVLPMRCPCHLASNIQSNSRNKRLKSPDNVRGALCLLSELNLQIWASCDTIACRGLPNAAGDAWKRPTFTEPTVTEGGRSAQFLTLESQHKNALVVG